MSKATRAKLKHLERMAWCYIHDCDYWMDRADRLIERQQDEIARIGVRKKMVFVVRKWLELFFFEQQQQPEKITVRIVTGKHGECDGPLIRQVVYSPSSTKLSKEAIATAIVTLSCEIVEICQERSDQLRETILCGIFLSHFYRDVDYYESKVLRFNPTDNPSS